ncbi:hypothetical protein MtrunA17_Chr4g0053101 [Medicago truncatula]|uniref:Transmembrane protein n=1 Tax=Medicago truncatula TaxID=3880 RepID=A0A396IJ67_MEDTR|nr:hypothetical protein MtrunA17_Chr4g0053101 [Medicago truncatula]
MINRVSRRCPRGLCFSSNRWFSSIIDVDIGEVFGLFFFFFVVVGV